jgi:type VI secretion system protein ImpE
MTPRALFEAGKVTEAIAALVEEVKKNPLDAARRGFLCELLCITGEFDRADAQLETIGKQDAKAAVAIALFRQLIRAEQARRQLFDEGRLPEFLDKPGDRLQLHLKATIALREGNAAEAAELLEQAEKLTPQLSGRCGDASFEGFRDLDDLTSSFFEVYTSTGKYYWIPFEQVVSVEIRPIESPRDLLWRRASMVVRNGPEGDVYLPAVYAGTGAETDQNLWLGRGTDWRPQASNIVRGVGQRMFLVGETDVPLHELTIIEFNAPESGSEA